MEAGGSMGTSVHDRGVAPILAVALLVGLTVAFAATIGAAALAFPTIDDSPPSVLDRQADPLSAAQPGDEDQIVAIAHEGGDVVDVSEVEIVVRLPQHDRETRIVDLPASESEGLRPSQVHGDDLVDRTNYRLDGPIAGDGDATWAAGDRLAFRIKHADDGVRLSPGETVEVIVVHEPTGGIILERELVAE